jgi:hypothetical protein
MSDTLSANLNLVKPEVGASDDTWGAKFNANLDAIDAIFAEAGGGTSVGLNVGLGKTLHVDGHLDLGATSVINIANGAAVPFVVNSLLSSIGGANKVPILDTRGNLNLGLGTGTWDSGGGASTITIGNNSLLLRPTWATEFKSGATFGGDDFFGHTFNGKWTGGGLGSMKAKAAGPVWAQVFGVNYFMVGATPINTNPGIDGDAALQWQLMVDRSGNAFSRTQYGVSDVRQKSALSVIERPLQKLAALGGYTYNMNHDTTRRYAGVIAQEIEAVLPEAVADVDGLLAVNLAGPVALLIECVKLLAERLETLEGAL